jgi:glycosyltransferase involved in cell wall biosynthesis
MRILIIIYEYPPIGGGGGQAAKDIAENLSSRGHEVRVITAHLKGVPKQEEIDGVQVIRVPSGRREAFKAGLGAMAGYVIAGFFAGRKLIRQWRPDIIHVHFAVPSGPVAWALSRSTGIPYVLTAHLGDVPAGVPEKTDRWFRLIYPFTHAIWKDAAQTAAVSEFTRQLALKHYPMDIQVIPNGVDLSLLDPGEIQVNDPARIFFAGRFMPQKNPLQLLRVLATLKESAWECIMLGDGPLRKDIEAEIKKHQMENRFTLPGWVTPQEVVQFLKKSDILFMPSLSEGLPVVGVQSLAMGLAVVASQAGGFIDLVDQGINGKLIDIEDINSFSETLSALVNNPQLLLTYRQASRKKAQEFDINKISESYERLFLNILN